MGDLSGGGPRATLFRRLPRCLKWTGGLLIGLLIFSCSGLHVKETRPHGVFHRVKSGETLSAIARAYRVDLQELAESNNITDADRIETDSVIFIPDANQILDDILIATRPREAVPAVEPKEKPEPKTKASSRAGISQEGPGGESKPKPLPTGDPKAAERTPAQRPGERETAARKTEGPPIRPTPDRPPIPPTPGTPPIRPTPETPPVRPKESGDRQEQIQFDKRRFIWPVKGPVVSPFGLQPNRMYFNGIRIAAGEGTAVQAAADGLVIFSAPLKDYGETIIIQHEDHYATVYARLGIRTVRGETRVRKGERIAFIGKTSEREEPLLHFEIRHSNKARNPLFFLP